MNRVILLVLVPALAGVFALGAARSGVAAAPGSDPDTPALPATAYLPVADEELAAALAEPAVHCVAADTASGCAPDPAPAVLHPDPPLPASAIPGA